MKAFNFIHPESDLTAVVQVLNAAHGTVAKQFGFTQETNPTNNAFIDSETLRSQLNSGIRLYGLTVDNILIGCIAIEESTKEAETFYIEKVSVLPEFRNQGRGVELMDFATDLIRKEGGRFVSIALIDSHAKLKSWYLSQGFQQTGVKAYEHLPFSVCFMNKELSPSKV
jgi:ribosomal protein S18 acetylase RimI-like enzyme